MAYDYELVLRDEDIFRPCDEHPDGTIEKFVDVSNLEFRALDNESVHIIGSIEIMRQIKPETSIQASLQIFKKNRDSWVNTVYNFNRPNGCEAAFDPSEIWHRFVENMPKDQQKCPFYTGVRSNQQNFIYFLLIFILFSKNYLLMPYRI